MGADIDDGSWLERAAADLGIALPPDTAGAFGRYRALLARWGAAIRLTGSRDPGSWTETHFLDSLTPLAFLPAAADRASPLIDVGSGAGLPGVPIAIARPDWSITLLEANARKAVFLRAVVAELGLRGVRVVCARAEAAPEPTYRTVISRAVCAPEAWLPLARPWVAPDGRVVAMLGREQPPTETLRRLGDRARLALCAVHTFRLPRSGAARAIVIWSPAP